MSEKLLSVECDGSRESVELHMDRHGLDYLIDILVKLRNEQPPEHLHLMSPDWGGDGLTGPPQNPEYIAAKHLKLCLWSM
jgi:hypothetical protein